MCGWVWVLVMEGEIDIGVLLGLDLGVVVSVLFGWEEVMVVVVVLLLGFGVLRLLFIKLLVRLLLRLKVFRLVKSMGELVLGLVIVFFL